MLRIAPAAATAVGSFPGTDVRETIRIVAGELAELPVVPELPGRGPGADMIGRVLGLMASVSMEWAGETTPTGWRISGPINSTLTRATRKAQSFLDEDLDVSEEVWTNHHGPIKFALVGPWTLASNLQLPSGDVILSDSGALRELVQAYNESLANLVANLKRRLPNAQWIIQLDEPNSRQVVTGEVPTQSGMATLSVVDSQDVKVSLANTISGLKDLGVQTAIHTCESRPPLDVLLAAKPDAVSIDLTAYSTESHYDEAIGRLLEDKVTLIAGILSVNNGAQDERRNSRDEFDLDQLTSRLDRLGIRSDDIVTNLALSPGCGFPSDGSDAQVRSAFDRLNVASRAIRGEDAAVNGGGFRDGRQ